MDTRDLFASRGGFGSGRNTTKQLLRASFDGREVVLKGYLRSRQEFEREVAALKQLHHPNIITATGVSKFQFDEAVVFYLELEYCRGGCISEWRETMQPARRTMVRMLRDVLRALSHVHAIRVGPDFATHSDVKDSNILVRLFLQWDFTLLTWACC